MMIVVTVVVPVVLVAKAVLLRSAL